MLNLACSRPILLDIDVVCHLMFLGKFLCILMCQYVRSNGEETNSRKRQYTHWPKKDAELVRTYFTDWISQSGQSTSLPCKPDIVKFLTMNPEIQLDWTTVRNKVLNEKVAYAKRKQKRLNSLHNH